MNTRKDYQRAAGLVRELRAGLLPSAVADELQAAFCRFFKGDNPRFDEDRFVTACQPGKVTVTVVREVCANALTDETEQVYARWLASVETGFGLVFGITLEGAGLGVSDLRHYWERHPVPGDFVQWFGVKYDLDQLTDPAFIGPKMAARASAWLRDNTSSEAPAK